MASRALALLPWTFAWLALAAGVGRGAEPTIVEEAPGDHYRFTGRMTGDPTALTRATVDLLFDWHGERHHYYVRLHGGQAAFHRVIDGQDQPIGVAGALRRSAAGYAFSLQRVGWRMTLIVNQAVAATAEDRAIDPGDVGYRAAGGVTVAEPEVQPTEEIWFADDFMRSDDQLGGWQTVFGTWTNNQQGSKSSRSANAFSFRCGGESPGLAVVGYPFWTDYLMQAAVRADGSGAAGVVVGYLDERHYLRMRCTTTNSPDGGTVRLQRVFAGQVTDLTPPIPGGLRPRVWYKLELALSGGRLLGWLDETPLFEVADLACGEGLVGLYGEPGEGDTELTGGALFDDVVVRSYPYFSDDFVAPSVGRWLAEGGWTLGTGPDGEASAPSTGTLLTGSPDWGDLEFEAQVRYDAGVVGLALHDGPQGRYEVRGGPRHLELVRLQDGAETVLDRAAAGIEPGAPHTLEVSYADGLIRARLDGQLCLEGFDLSHPSGRCGLLVAGAQSARFDRVRCRFRPTHYVPPPTVPSEFEQDQYMTSWASPGAAWVVVEGSKAHWHKGFFYGDRAVRFEIPGFGQQTGKVSIILGASSTDEADACRLNLELATAEPRLRLALLRGEQVLAEAQPTVTADRPVVLFELRGRFLIVRVDGHVVIQSELTEAAP